MRKISILIALSLLSVQVHAFGVASASLASYIYVAILLPAIAMLGAVAKKSGRENYKALVLFGLAMTSITVFLSCKIYLSTEYMSSALENEYFPEDVGVNYIEGEIEFISIDDAIKKSKDDSVRTIRITEKKIPYIYGSDIIYFRDAERWARSIAAESKPRNIIVASRYMAEGLTAYKAINEALNVKASYVDIANININKKLSESSENLESVNLNFVRHAGLDLDEFNYIAIYGDRSYNTYVINGAYLISSLSLLTWSDNDWDKLKRSLDYRKKIKIILTDNDTDGMKIINYVSRKIEAKGSVYFDFPVGDIHIGKLTRYLFEYQNTQLTERFNNYNRYLSPAELYAKQEVYDNISIICFSANCYNQFPRNINNINFFNVINAEKEGMYSIQNGKLKFDLSKLNRNGRYIISPEDSSTLMLAINMGNAIDDIGFDFDGFTYHFSNYYGSVFHRSQSGEVSSMLYDSPLIKSATSLLKYKELAVKKELMHINETLILIMGVGLAVLYFCDRAGRIASLFAIAFLPIIGTDNVSAEMLMATNILTPGAIGVMTGLVFLTESNISNNMSVRYIVKTTMLLSVVVLTSAFIVHSSALSTALLYAEIMGIILVLKAVLIAISRARSNNVQVGDKYSLTHQFTTDKGFICAYPDFDIPDSRIRNGKKWIIRSNHINEMESGAAGIFESRVLMAINAKKAIVDMRINAEKILRPENVQFWIQDYIECKQRGVMESLARGHFFSIGHSYSIGNETSINDGTSHANYKMINRMSVAEIDKTIVDKIRNIERTMGVPVVIEYGIDHNNRMHIFQVRPQQIDQCADRDIIRDIISTNINDLVLVETFTYTMLERSLLYRLYGESILIDAYRAYRKQGRIVSFNEALVMSAVEAVSARSKSDDTVVLRGRGLTALIHEYYEILMPLVFMKETAGGAIDDHLRSKIETAMRDNSPQGINIEINGREMIKLPFSMAMSQLKTVIAEAYSMENIDLISVDAIINRPGISVLNEYREYISSITMTAALNNAEDSYVIYPGKIKEQFCSIQESIAMNSEKQRKEFTLLVDYVPSEQMGLVRQHAAVVSLFGGPLSHLAVTARHYEIPCLIGSNHFKKFCELKDGAELEKFH